MSSREFVPSEWKENLMDNCSTYEVSLEPNINTWRQISWVQTQTAICYAPPPRRPAPPAPSQPADSEDFWGVKKETSWPHLHLHGWRQRTETCGWRCYTKPLGHRRGSTVCGDSRCFRLRHCSVAGSQGVLIGELDSPLPHSFTTSPSSDTTWCSKRLTEPSATPLS